MSELKSSLIILFLKHKDLDLKQSYFLFLLLFYLWLRLLYQLQRSHKIILLDKLRNDGLPKLLVILEDIQSKLQSLVGLLILLLHLLSVFKLDHFSHQNHVFGSQYAVFVDEASCPITFFLFFVEFHVFQEHIDDFLLWETVVDWDLYEHFTDYETVALLGIFSLFEPLLTGYVRTIFLEDLPSFCEDCFYLFIDMRNGLDFGLSLL